MKIRTITVFNCEFCNKLYQRKHAAWQHERRCLKNPANHRPCFQCKHLTKKETRVDDDEKNDMENEYYRKIATKSLLYCNAKNTFLYTPVNEIKGNQMYPENETNEPMPRECKLQSVLEFMPGGDIAEQIINRK